jgi:vitamin B12 transporter
MQPFSRENVSMKTTFSILIFTSFLIASDLSGISGVVVDQSGRAVPGAVVQCSDQRAVSGADGHFLIDAAADCQAAISKPGFETSHETLIAGKPSRVELTLAVLSERVLVSATRTTATLEESGVSSTIITRRDLEARQFPPVLDLLRDVPGLEVVNTSRNGGLTGVFTRGAQRTGTLFLLDGVPLNEPGGEMNLAQLTSTGLERIEIVRGPESALFGAEAAAGIVQLFTSRGDSESNVPHGKVSYERGSFSTDHWSANVNGGLASHLDYSLTANQFHTAGMFPNDYFRNTTGSANIGWHLRPSTQVRAIFREFDAIAGNPNAVGYGIFDRDANGEDRDSAFNIRLDDARGTHFTQRISFAYHRLRDRFNDSLIDGPYTVAAFVRRVPGTIPQTYFAGLADPNTPLSEVPPGLSLVKTTTTLYPFGGLTITSRKDADYQGTVAHKGGALVFGYEFERQEGNISQGTVTRENNGGFIHEQYRIGRRLYLTAGARLEHSSTFGSRMAPRASATYAISSSTFLRASAGRGITEPSLLQNFARESFYVGNPALRPEKIDSYDAGIVQELFGRRVRAEATVFRNSFDDLIVFDFSTNPASWKNIDRSWARGVETAITVRPLRFVQVSANWTRLYTKVTRSNSTLVGQELPRRAKNSGSAWISLTPRRWTLLAGGRFVGERQDADFVFGVTRNPGYGTMYFSGSYALAKHVTPFLRIDNLLNERYEEVLGYTSLTRNAVGGVRVTW